MNEQVILLPNGNFLNIGTTTTPQLPQPTTWGFKVENLHNLQSVTVDERKCKPVFPKCEQVENVDIYNHSFSETMMMIAATAIFITSLPIAIMGL